MSIKDRSAKLGSVSNDPLMIRHLHDLSAVDAMSYAPDDESISFEMALASFERIVRLLI